MGFDNDPTAGTSLVLGSIHSPNYAQGAAGWTINRDGSAEFQNVLVRGTITASNIIGSTITGGTIVGGDFQSANFSNTLHTGFDLNANPTADAAGTPGNTIQIYSNFVVGPINGANVQLGFSATEGALLIFTGAAAQTLPGTIFGNVSGTTPQLVIEGVQGTSGFSEMIFNSPTTTAPGVVTLQSSSSVPTISGVKGQFNLGEAVSDTWCLTVNNENSVGSGNFPGIIIGNNFTPQSRMFISPSEIWSVNGSNAVETLYLNETNVEGSPGGVLNKILRQASGDDFTNTYAVTTTQATGTTASATFLCPASGVATVIMKFTVTAVAAPVAASFCYGTIHISNTTQATVPFSGSANRSAEVDGVAMPTNGSIISLSYNVTASSLGNPGDTMVAVGQFAASAAALYTVKKVEISVIPSL
jgi:hypothetical protein